MLQHKLQETFKLGRACKNQELLQKEELISTFRNDYGKEKCRNFLRVFY